MELIPLANQNIPRTEEERNQIIENAALAYEKFMDALGFDWRNDPHSKGTPKRVAKAFVNDIIGGCYSPAPVITDFTNTERYDGMVCETNIPVKSICSHHHLGFLGKAHVAYIPKVDGTVIGLSKLNRIVDWYSRRPQVQESLTMQIHDHINNSCKNNMGVAVMIECDHLCCACRGIRHESTMRTAKMSGVFMDNSNLARNEFYEFVKLAKHPVR